MRENELELIAALVEGRLQDEAEARALIASGPEFAAEYEAQKSAYEVLRSMGSATMSDTEKADLHRDLWTALRTPAPTRASSPWYYRWMPVAAGMFVVVGLVAVLGQDGDSDGDSRQFAVTTAASAETSGDNASGGTVEATDGGSPVAPVAEPLPDPGEDVTPETMALEPAQEAYYQAEADEVREGELSGVNVEDTEGDLTESELKDCIDEAGLDDYEVVGARSIARVDETTGSTVSAPVDVSSYIAAVPAGATLADAPVAFVDLASCVLIHLDQ